MTSGIIPMTQKPAESTHHRLFQLVKTALINIFVSPYATVCDLYCGRVADEDKWDEALIGHYIGIDVDSSEVNEIRQEWESKGKAYTYQFFDLDPSVENVELGLEDNMADVVCCMQHLQFCFDNEERVRRLLHNVATLLKPGGYFFGITPDSSTIWAKYQKNVEAYHNKSSSMKPNIVPNCIRTENYMITFEVEEEKFPFFGKKYQFKFANDNSAENYCLVHFPSLISLYRIYKHQEVEEYTSQYSVVEEEMDENLRLAREAGLEYVEIQNLTEFYDDNRAQFAGMLVDGGHNLVDSRGRLLPRSYDVLGLYTTFIFQKPDPDIAPPLMTPLLNDTNQNLDEWNFSSSKRSMSTWENRGLK
ncbi:mRNA cap guanine-N7 methyltransferase 2 isoform X2 [Daucus carota subsp. sativus]|uniref:mRNA cap guanine-N7 methyltransferase 2 isoform X2 n=1 Tax=Daucus carota subsp. sativus TaxID=79200 RepID=UPI003083ED62